MGADAQRSDRPDPPVINTEGDILAGDFVLICEHASNFIPDTFTNLGLGDGDLKTHIAWDIGALALARAISERLGCGLVHAGTSRLIIDLNRPEEAVDLIPQISETTSVPGNINLSPPERQSRIDRYYTPFHTQLDALLDARAKAGRLTHIVSLHSFTPTYMGRSRPWHVGIIHDRKSAFALRLLADLRQNEDLDVGENQPYTPADRVYHTLSVHGDERGWPTAMIEIRNDGLGNPADIGVWADRLAKAIFSAGENREAHREAV